MLNLFDTALLPTHRPVFLEPVRIYTGILWFHIGMTAYHLKNWDEAVPSLERSLSLSKSHESTVRKIYAMLAGCWLEQGDNAKAKEWIDKGLALFPHDPELLFRAGIVYREVGDFAAAERSYMTLLTARESGHIDSLDVSMTTYKGRHNLAVLYRDMGRLADAEAQFREALKYSADFVPSWLGLGEIFLQQGRFEDVREVVNRVSPLALQEAASLRHRLGQAIGNPAL